jgi:hypothetical protein
MASVATLPDPSGNVTSVQNVAELERAVQHAAAGETIMVAEGEYRLSTMLRIGVDGVTLRGTSGDPSKVTLDGSELRYGEAIGLFECAGVTIANLTIQNVRLNALKINSDHGQGVHQLTVHNCVFRNFWQRAIKSVQIREPHQAPREVVIRHCRFSNDRPKTFDDDPSDQPGASFDGNYVGGIDAMYARNWTITDNLFTKIQGRTGSGRAAVFLWVDSRDCVVKRNLMIDCDRGIELGNTHIPPHITDHCTAINVHENQITRSPMGAITVTATRECQIERNAIHDPDNRFGRTIRIIGGNSGLVVASNLIAGPPPRMEPDESDQIIIRGNRGGLASSFFVDAEAGDLRPAVVP